MELGRRYAEERVQFGESLIAFPRVADKIADDGGGGDDRAPDHLPCGAAEGFRPALRSRGRDGPSLLAARVAGAAADNALQIHGGNGFALEYPVSRVLCDARILNIFEGAAEIQAHVIARRLLDGSN